MTISLQKMEVDEFAAYERAQGETIVVHTGGVYWRRVRPFFYCPLLPYQEHPRGSIRAPWQAHLGGFQYAVPSRQPANSFLQLCFAGDTATYTLDALDARRRWEIRQAGKHHIVRPVKSVDEFKRQAYPVYRTFLDRTHYAFRSDRKGKSVFSRWADSVYQFPKIVVLGAYRGDDLGAVNISALVEDTLIYSSVFCDNECLRANVTSLLLHTVRELAAGCPGVKRIYLGRENPLHGTGVRDFYVLRGCRIVAQPAVLHLNPVSSLLLRCFLPRYYAALSGQSKQNTGEVVQEENVDVRAAQGGTTSSRVPPVRAAAAPLAEVAERRKDPR